MGMVGAASGGRLRAYAFTLVTTAIVLIFALAEWSSERFVADRSRAAGVALEITIVLITAVVFRPVHRRVEYAVEQAFYRRKHQALTALSKFRGELSSYSEIPQLLRRVIEAVEQYLEAPACAVFLRRQRYHAEASSFEAAVQDIDPNDPLVVRLRSSSAPAQPRLLDSSAQGTHAFPMTAAGDLVGILLVRCGHGDYDAEEAQMLAGLAQDLAVAVVALDPQLRARKTHRNNIPADLPVLIGRERERSEMKAALSRSRLVTLTGPGGVGKTCIALHCAAEAVAEHEHGAWFINLAPISDANLITATILTALGAGAAEEGDDMLRLLAYLQSRNCMLVVDNCEQFIGNAAAIISQIRAACPDVTILTTSREMLHLEGEHVYRLGPLRIEAGVELFCRRAAAVLPEFDPRASAGAVGSICEHLDGIPLAIELAAARMRTLNANEVLEHLDARFRLLTTGMRDALPRQQTLAATIEWSYDLLTSQEQSLFLRLAAFRGSFSLAAAAAVCAQGGACDEFHTLDVLTSLADKSLLIVTLGPATRYRLLETIREFGSQKALEQQTAAIARQQHAAYYAALAAQAYHEFDTRLPQGWLDRLAPDIDNFRAALVFMLEGPGDRHAGAQLAADCGPMFLRYGLLTEGLRWCDAARNLGGLPPATAGRIDYVASMMHNNSRDYEHALSCAKRAVSLYRQSEDRRGLIRALSQTAHLYARANRRKEAQDAAAQAIQGARLLGEVRLLIAVLRRCAFSLPPAEIGRARELFAEALRTAEEAHETDELCMLLQWWAGSEAAARCFDRAMQLGVRALDCADPDTKMYLESDIAGYALASADYGLAGEHARRALRLALDFRHPVLTALGLAYCSQSLEDPKASALVAGYAGARLRDLHFTADGSEKAALFNTLQCLQQRLDSNGIASLLDQGSALREEQAVSLALEHSALGGSHDGAVGAGDRIGALLG